MKKVIRQFLSGSQMGFFYTAVLLGLLVNHHATAQEFAVDFGRSATEINVGEDNMQRLQLNFTYSGLNTFVVETDKGLQFNEINIPGTYWIGELGTPKLPASKKLIEIPFGAEVQVSVKNYTTTKYNLQDYGIKLPVFPNQP
ncbi:MAG TPA: C25 family peptidase propeptide domain-containing protein, partial [Bacteroidales bacterium]|nr:C25 family peptidase propeptide domain-containing protein [Bacteroidales bacterium]